MFYARFYTTYVLATFLFLILSGSVASNSASGHPQSGKMTGRVRRIPLSPQEQHRLNLQLAEAAGGNVNNYAHFRQLLAQGADPNVPQYFNGAPHTTGNSTTWLMWFAELGDAQTIHSLLYYGAYVNARGLGYCAMGNDDLHHSTALIVACCRSGNWDVIQLLLQHGADVNARDISDNTPLRMAAWQSEWDECRLLLRYGARRGLLNKEWRQILRGGLTEPLQQP